MRIIAIAGKARNGKDTVAAMMKEELEARGQRCLITKYGDFLKFILKDYFGWNGLKDEAGRTLLQYVGTNVVRKNYPNAWVDMMKAFLKGIETEFDYVLIPDCRFPNEVEWIAEGSGNKTLRVVRYNYTSDLTIEQQQHPSETSLDNYYFDAYLINDGTLDDLRQDVVDYVKELIEGDPIT